MDNNKLKVLKKINYKSTECCGTCVHARMAKGYDFGTCKKFTYQHEKHSDTVRELSINRYGVCDKHAPDRTSEANAFFCYLEN